MLNYPKKDRDEAIRIGEILAEDGAGFPDRVSHTLDCLKPRKGEAEIDRSHLTFNLAMMETYFYEYAIIQRVLHKDLDTLVCGLQTSARLDYLVRIVGGTGYSGSDAAHIWGLLRSLSVNDQTAVQAYTNHIPGPFKDSHPTVLLCLNGLYMALGALKVDNQVVTKLKARKCSKFSMALMQAIAALLEKDKDVFIAAIDQMVAFYRRRQELDSVPKMLAVEAHALVNLWETNQPPLTEQDLPKKLPWDIALHETVRTKTATTFDCSAQSPTLADWLTQLPGSLSFEALERESGYKN